ncbi:rod shape-determining protein MreD [Microbispora oryzae]|uniref:rod shape-determining protein MreD n=1 Tax=Microbispora oryzae TaxID=2806554 RepID=UPI0027DE9103|nr:rod shape-determining protein MreD [Microbispora oryzae]
MRAALLTVAVVVLAPVFQVMVVNGLGLPGGGPDVVLVAVVALASRPRPPVAALLGFAAGLAADVAPPADHTIGRTALVLCLAAWACARIPARSPSRLNGRLDGRSPEETTRLAAGTAAAVAAVATPLQAALALVLGDASWDAVLHRTPGVLCWTVPAAALVAYAAARLPRARGRRQGYGRRYGRGYDRTLRRHRPWRYGA